MPLLVGQVFAGYTVLRILGAGGMGQVYLVAHPRLPREDALKEAAEARDLLKTTLASIGDAVISTDAAGRVILANPVACSLMRWSELANTSRTTA